MVLSLSAFLMWPLAEASANVDSACDLNGDGETDNFDASLTTPDIQEWNIAASTALAMAPSPLTSPSPYKAFQVAIGLDLHQFDYLSCQERTVFLGGIQKTEDTNKTPVVPRFRFSMGLPMGGYVTISGLPPLTLFGVRTGVITGEVGGGFGLGDSPARLGVRLHASSGQIVGDIAHPVGMEPGDEGYDDASVDDEYQFLNVGADAAVSWAIELPKLSIFPYAGAGVLNVSSIFYVGETYYTVFLGDHYTKYMHEENPGPVNEAGQLTPYPGYRGLDAFAGVRVAFLEHFEGTLEGFFIPVRTVIGSDERFLTETGETSPYVSNFFSLRLRLGYMF